MKKITIALFFFTNVTAFAQTETTNALDEKYSYRTFFLYNNTLRMLNQGSDKGFDELIKDIEKMKVVWIDKKEKNFGPEQYKKLMTSYKSEKFEPVMNTRYDGFSMDAYIKEKDGDTKGIVITVDDKENVFVFDIVGKVALNKMKTVFDSNPDMGETIKKMMENKQWK